MTVEGKLGREGAAREGKPAATSPPGLGANRLRPSCYLSLGRVEEPHETLD